MNRSYNSFVDKLNMPADFHSRTLEAMLAAKTRQSRRGLSGILYLAAALMLAAALTFAIPASRTWALELLNQVFSSMGGAFTPQGQPRYQLEGLHELVQTAQATDAPERDICSVDQIVLDAERLIVTFKMGMPAGQTRLLVAPNLYIPSMKRRVYPVSHGVVEGAGGTSYIYTEYVVTSNFMKRDLPFPRDPAMLDINKNAIITQNRLGSPIRSRWNLPCTLQCIPPNPPRGRLRSASPSTVPNAARTTHISMKSRLPFPTARRSRSGRAA